MVVKRMELHQQEEIPEIDEGWWASILADEGETLSEANAGTAAQSEGSAGLVTVDWQLARQLYENDEIVVMKVYGSNRGGLLVTGNGIQGFVPISHLVNVPSGLDEEQRRARLASYIGQNLNLKVIECEPVQERIVLSERAALAGEGKRKQLFNSLKTGDLVEGVVTNVTEFGVFVDLGGVEGLIHVSELSWGRVQHPNEVLQVGKDVRALVLQVNEESARVALSLKRLYENPWETVVNRYHPGDILPATITKVVGFGAFARLAEGIEGLIHISSIPLPSDCKTIEQYLSQGQPVQVEILHIDAERRRLGLGLVNVE
ncbi:MAG: 30S ribosomal protein S1 [Anaerolineae bacterium]|nr:30S ribosomal protein S1 [Anaerolineae bacterium]